jgi:predicted dehydrogenase
METVMNTNKKIKLLCVGIGGFAEVYLREFLADNEPIFDFVGAVDPYAENSKYFNELKERKIPIYNSMDEFYAEHNADFVVISTPIHFHTRQIIFALEHGSNVLCEKPLSGVSSDAELIEEAAKKAGKFVMIGFQWSYAPAINALKDDIRNGVLGEPEMLKTIILWPRKKEYFTRSSGWSGKLRAKDGTVINDSIAANACAHFIHNILYVCGEPNLAAEASDVKADLIRANDIENFDTATISFTLKNGAKCLFVASHSTNVNTEPIFEYRFKNATVKYAEGTKDIIAYFNNGEVKHYGNPFGPSNANKAYIGMRGCLEDNYTPLCTHITAAEHTKLIEKVQQNEIKSFSPDFLTDDGTIIKVNGLTEALRECFDREVMISETDFYKKAVK